MTIRLTHLPMIAALSAAALLGFTSPSAAQAGRSDPRWEAWIGCWQPVDPSGLSDVRAPVVCVTPTTLASAVQVSTVENGAVTARDTIDAGGSERRIDKQGCVGTESGRWSPDDKRVYVRSDVTCTGGIKRVGNGILAMTPTGQWLDVRSVNVGGSAVVRAARYRESQAPASALPAEFARLNTDRGMSVSAARALVGGALDVATIADAVKRLDTAVVQAWIVERGTRFNLNAKQLVALADAGVPGSVTDVMIGVSYPEHFALERRDVATGMNAGAYALSAADSARLVRDYLQDRCFMGVPSLSLDDPCRYANRYGSYGRYMYDDYRYGYSPYGYSYYGYSPYSMYGTGYFGTGYYYGGPVVVVRGNDEPHGQVVKGRGYTRGDGASSTSGSKPAASRGSGDSGSSGSSGSSGASSGSSGSSSSGSSTGRTAHPRPPV